jgi:hypothetical protein
MGARDGICRGDRMRRRSAPYVFGDPTVSYAMKGNHHAANKIVTGGRQSGA